ncbi:hypothetical protein LIER_38125 [Lithospermum erythrorhizon]|uniref:DUF4216 domain-containing protein n=1 Tax=Lithospermum erythrorhizon TaxID=34254 RepID=A0AAV3PX20_LITER
MIEEMYPQLIPTQTDQMINNNFIEYLKNYVHPKNGMVQLKFKKNGPQDDPFILASQAQEVFYLDFVSDDKKHLQWVVPTKTFARTRIDWTNSQDDDDNNDDFFQEDEQPVPIPIQPTLELDDDHILVVPDLYDDEK